MHPSPRRYGISRVDVYHQKPFAFAIHTNPGDPNGVSIYAAVSNAVEYNLWMAALAAVTTSDDDDNVPADEEVERVDDHVYT